MYSKKVICLLSLAFVFILYAILRGRPISVCQTEVCRKEAKRILSNLNTSVDPCVDFHKYSCGGWMSSHVLASDQSSLDLFITIQQTVTERLRDMYLKAEDKDELYPMAFVRRLYEGCVDDEKGSLEPLRDLLASLGGWPLVSGHRPVYGWKQVFTNIMSQNGVAINPETLITVYVVPDLENALTNRIFLGQPSLSLGRKDFLSSDSSSEKLRKAYSEYITNTALLFGAERDIREDVQRLIRFETEIAKISSPIERRNYEKNYRILTFAELKKQIPEVDWFELIVDIYEKIGSNVLPEEGDKIVISNIHYVKQVSSLLKKTETSVVNNFLIWGVIQNMALFGPRELRDIHFNFDKIQTGIQKPVEAWKRCLSLIEKYVPDLIGRKYIDAYFTENERKVAENIIKVVSTAYENLIESKDWFDSTTKRRAIEKLRAVANNVGYPLWLKNNTDLVSVYNFSREIDPRNTFEGMTYVKRYMTKKMFEELPKNVDKEREWAAGPTMANAFYYYQQNSINFPVGFLNIPVFNADRPGFLNYGEFGTLVGHELTHGFDDEGSQFDKDGNLFNWWSNHTKAEFNKRAKCFKDQYSSVFVERVNMPLNGNNTVGENIADNGGLREAFHAYHSHYNDRNPDQTLPGLEKYSSDQLFFISFANNWCAILRDPLYRQRLLYDYHSPEEYRVNIPVSNFESFAKAFDCKPGTPMNPPDEKRCILW